MCDRNPVLLLVPRTRRPITHKETMSGHFWRSLVLRFKSATLLGQRKSGSDRAADRWRDDYRHRPGVVGRLDLHHLYPGGLGEETAGAGAGRPPRRSPPRCHVKDAVEERLFAYPRRDLPAHAARPVFMDTTSLYFEGAGGQTLGQHGYSEDHRSDLRQMILAVLIDGDGRPMCSEMWPGNTADGSDADPG